ncbi:hypothetical protein [Crocinitomix catalasitica]|uniref:hypothetical protein n=1 Tax=Crocinitomix catalasitica TaxID=184607 RepID=UPI00047FDDE2|nr:hypothetical protein [Crocinitomix catalasitica]
MAQKNIPFQFGNKSVVWTNVFENKYSNVLFLNVHEDEQTSIEAIIKVSAERELNFWQLKHDSTRRISFKDNKHNMSFDPNRMFTFKGRYKTLKDGGKFTFRSNKLVKLLAEEVVSTLSSFETVVALHNNTDVNYSIKSYAEGGDEAENTSAIHISPTWDADDFIYTTDYDLFLAFKTLDLNVIYQNDKKFVNDGSLSVYCGLNNIPYVNIETQLGHLEEQIKLINLVLDVLKEK